MEDIRIIIMSVNFAQQPGGFRKKQRYDRH